MANGKRQKYNYGGNEYSLSADLTEEEALNKIKTHLGEDITANTIGQGIPIPPVTTSPV